MGIELKLFATLAPLLPENSADYPIEEGETIRSLMVKVGIPEKDVAIMFVNSLKVELDTEIKDKDRVGLFPAVGGG
ncbi:MoaD/ThiS family protein [Pseudodesulfovibrio cashew]|uniref:MoaD/ThiS family protein n=1 Tax=Pseudodesulfovibrio cashew TaxID=2678688 RepID=A0A6I6JFM4_9BACT|nr:MoaD/ThiS family protein [Pseudodesulfovibrio cashew]QGY40971.1 MoaD/ThiS family protein [Pseudodesulfovibrio cashew]